MKWRPVTGGPIGRLRGLGERSMPDKANDPAAIWRGFLGDLETGFNSFANKAMESEGFSRVMNQAGGASMAAQKALGEAMEKYLTSMNLPSRTQFIAMGERLQGIENQLVEIKAMLHQMGQSGGAAEDGGAGVRGPPRTRQPPSRGEPG
jgi:hypothetical protein